MNKPLDRLDESRIVRPGDFIEFPRFDDPSARAGGGDVTHPDPGAPRCFWCGKPCIEAFAIERGTAAVCSRRCQQEIRRAVKEGSR